MNTRVSVLTGVALIFGVALSAQADTSDFGGYSERIKGGGDKVPPRCQIDAPTASTEPFFVKWNCSDNFTKAEDIRTELWLYRNGAPTGELVANFLGFPASVFVDQGLLGVTEFTSGLPASLKLLAKDRSGNATISPILTVRAQDNNVSTCSIKVETEATESSGDTTGTPGLSVEVGSAKVNVSQPSDTQVAVASAGTLTGEPCEIRSICFNGSHFTFSSALTLEGSDSASGTVSIIPGSLVVNVSGSTTVDGVMLKGLDVSGETKIDGVDATVSLSCTR